MTKQDKLQVLYLLEELLECNPSEGSSEEVAIHGKALAWVESLIEKAGK